MSRQPVFLFRNAVHFLAIFLLWPLAPGVAADLPATAVISNAPETNSLELRTYLQLQEQLHATQLAVERNRKESLDAAAQTAEVLTTRLQGIEQSLGTQRARELDAMQNSNRVMLIVAGAFAAMGFLAMVLMAFFQWRTVTRLAEMSAALPAAGLGYNQKRAIAELGPGDSPVANPMALPPPNSGLLDALQRLEKRIGELEHTSHSSLVNNLALAEPKIAEHPAAPENGAPSSEAAQVALLLQQGQALLNNDKPDEALACFEEALELDEHHADALVKKGTALERLRKFEDAIECYDQAIQADASMTIAYLYKGGLFNRMERFSEALECYEKALRTQETRRAA